MRVTVHAVVLVILFCPSLATAQTTPWGDPDLQGIWSNQTPVPLERPAALAGKPYFTEAEAAEAEKNALASVLKNVAADIPTSGNIINAVPLRLPYANGSTISTEGADLIQVEDGLIRRLDSYWDDSAIARQIGVLPARKSAQERVLLGLFNTKTRLKSLFGRRRRT